MRRKRDWPTLIREHEKSGMTVASFCSERGINPNLFYRHRKRRDRGTFVEVAVDQVSLNPEPIVLNASGHRLEISPGFDSETLKAILQVLAEVP